MGQAYENQTPPSETSFVGEPSQRRVALVIGNSAYQHTAPLKNPGNDARDVAQALTELGFEVVGGDKTGTDLGLGAMTDQIRNFGRLLRDDVSTALLFYAGHGIQVAGRNYLVPIEAALEYEVDIGLELIELQGLLNHMERPNRTSIVLLDACRNNPLAKNLGRAMGLSNARDVQISQGLAAQSVVAGSYIAYATQPDYVAYDGDTDNGHFTEALLAEFKTPGQSLSDMMINVRNRVVQATSDKPRGPQVPWDHSSLMGAFYFKPTCHGAPHCNGA